MVKRRSGNTDAATTAHAAGPGRASFGPAPERLAPPPPPVARRSFRGRECVRRGGGLAGGVRAPDPRRDAP